MLLTHLKLGLGPLVRPLYRGSKCKLPNPIKHFNNIGQNMAIGFGLQTAIKLKMDPYLKLYFRKIIQSQT